MLLVKRWDFTRRANQLFEIAREVIKNECEEMHSAHSAAGRLGSGATAKAAIEIYRQRMSDALNQILNEAAKVIDHRGRAWRFAMDSIAKALTEQEQSSYATLARSFGLARADTGSARKAVDDLLAKAARDLRQELDFFNEGWTAPVPERWTTRHPALYAVLLLIGGSVFGGVVAHYWPTPQSSAPAKPG